MEGFSTRFGSSFGAYNAPPKKKKTPKKDTGGVFGFLENLVDDVRDTVVGLPAGVAKMVQDPIGSFKEIGVATWKDWAPLVHGEYGEWWENFTEHPLSPILDVAGVLTLGAGSAAKGAGALGKLEQAGKISADSAIARAAEKVGGSRIVRVEDATGAFVDRKVIGRGSSRAIKVPGAPTVTRHYAANPVVRMRQKGFESLGSKLAGGSGKAGTGTKKAAEAGKSAKWSNQGDVGQYELKGVFAKLGGDARYVNKSLAKQRAARAAGFKHALYSSMLAAKKMHGKGTPASKEALFRDIERKAYQQFDEHALAMSKKGDSKTGLARGWAYQTDPKWITEAPLPKVFDAKGWHDGIAKMGAKGGWWTKDPTKALIDPRSGKPRIVRVGEAKGWLQEGAHSSKFLDVLWNKPTTIWKTMVLAYSPRFFVNNVVGNSLMYFMATNPKAAVEGLHSAYRDMKHPDGGAWQRWMGHETGGLGDAELAQVRRSDWSKKGRAKATAASGLFPLTHKWAEDLIRSATFHHSIKRTPEYLALRTLGHDHLTAINKAAAIPEVRNYTRTAVHNVLGDYNYLTRSEQAIKKVVPFYTWDRAILRHTREMVLNRPEQAAVLAKIGEMGTEATLEALGGEVPEFLKGAIPIGDNKVLSLLGLSKPGPGRKSILTTHGINPYATVGDLAGAGASIVGIGERRAGETVGSQINPLAAGAVEWLTGASLLSGAPVNRGGGAIGNIYGNAVESTTQVKLLETLVKGAPKSRKDKPRLFKGDTQQQLLSLLGAPLREYSPKTAGEIYWREKGGKKTKSRTYAPSHYSGLYKAGDTMPKF